MYRAELIPVELHDCFVYGKDAELLVNARIALVERAKLANSSRALCSNIAGTCAGQFVCYTLNNAHLTYVRPSKNLN